MTRKKLYDENEVLEKAMYSFWEHGFRGVTTRDLASSMGINQFSVYASFENKEKLFVKSLEYYYENLFIQRTLRPLSDSPLNLENLKQFLQQFVDTSETDYPLGCFICNTMIEDSSVRDQADEVIQRYTNIVKEAFQTVIRSSHPEADDALIQKKTGFLFGSFLGLTMLKRMGANGNPIQNYVNELLAAISN
ncbi:TetR/AcrR family transcriptional regulator [bacterium]|nr:TetR/AcrR family transcriptional regulator [bacterium]